MPENENSKKIICLTDNDEDDRMLLHEALLEFEMPFEIMELCSAEQLMDRLSRPGTRLPDFVFLDLALHGISGFDCIGQIRKQDSGRSIKVIVYTFDHSASTMERAFLLGADFYAVKPNTYRDLKGLVEKVFQTDWDTAGTRQRIFHAL